VLQALSLAGGLTVYADDDDISVLRRVGNQIKVFPFDYDDVLKGKHLEQNIILEAGDTVTVP
jgi:polysaccharide export outer membrane protein